MNCTHIKYITIIFSHKQNQDNQDPEPGAGETPADQSQSSIMSVALSLADLFVSGSHLHGVSLIYCQILLGH